MGIDLYIDLAFKAAIVVALIWALKHKPTLIVIVLATALTACNGNTLCSGRATLGPLGLGFDVTCETSEPPAPPVAHPPAREALPPGNSTR